MKHWLSAGFRINVYTCIYILEEEHMPVHKLFFLIVFCFLRKTPWNILSLCFCFMFLFLFLFASICILVVFYCSKTLYLSLSFPFFRLLQFPLLLFFMGNDYFLCALVLQTATFRLLCFCHVSLISTSFFTFNYSYCVLYIRVCYFMLSIHIFIVRG